MMTPEEKKLRDSIRNKKYYESHRRSINERCRKYNKTQLGRARHLLLNYNQYDRDANRGQGDLTPEWIVDNIFTKPCVHCGETDWRKIGCNRLDNSKPHTTDNVEPCCLKCNVKLNSIELSKKVFQYNLDGSLVKTWNSVSECNRNGYHGSNISNCCNGKAKTYKGYIWSFNQHCDEC